MCRLNCALLVAAAVNAASGMVHSGDTCNDHALQTLALHCASPLVSYMSSMHNDNGNGEDKNAADTLWPGHPPLQHVDEWCDSYDEYEHCLRRENVPQQCRPAAMAKVFAAICEPEIRENITTSRQCLMGMSADARLPECHRNMTQTLFLSGGEDMDGKNDTGKMSYGCAMSQAFIDCLLQNDYWENCPDTVQLEYRVLESLVDGDCPLTFTAPEPDHRQPKCDASTGICTCSDGFLFDAETKYCADINECDQLPPLCAQKCVNTEGAYRCECDQRYFVLEEETGGCLSKDKSPMWILFAHGQSIWNISADGKDFSLQRAGLQKTAMIDVDMKENKLYYADIGADKIETMDLDGVFPKTIQFYEVDGMEGIGVDWIARNLYSVRKNDIWVQKLDGRFRRILYKDVMKLPRALAVDPINGYGYVTDWGSNAFLARFALDGSHFEPIITAGVVWPNALAIDHYAQRIYFADAFLDTIESADLDGGRRAKVLTESGSVPHVFGMAVTSEYVYWTDWTYRGILRADKRTGGNATVLAQTALLPYSVKIYHTETQPDGPNPCATFNCGQLCLLSPTLDANDTAASPLRGQCACAEGFQLAGDQKTCVSKCDDDKQVLCGGSDPRCISKIYWCDGVTHCWDHEDERDCQKQCGTNKPPNTRRICLPNQFQCHDGKQCVAAGSVCNSDPQCNDKSDEAFCS